MEKDPLVSIFCSIYKGEEYIAHYLKDITEQTIFQDCELILVDANSPQDEEVFIRKYKEKYKNITYIKLDNDPGLYSCWNIAIKNASGKYLNNANLDDAKHPTALEKQVEFLEKNPDVDLVYADSLIVDTPNQSFDNSLPISRYNFPDFSIENLIIYNMPHQSPVYRASLHEKFGYFEEKYESAADTEFWLRCATQGSKMKKLDEVLGVYFLNPKGVSTGSHNESAKREEEAKIKEKYAKLNNYSGRLYGALSDISGL